MSRLFHTLVVVGAGIGTTGCGGRSGERIDPSPTSGTGGSGSGQSGAGGGGQGGAGGVGGGGLGGSLGSAGVGGGGLGGSLGGAGVGTGGQGGAGVGGQSGAGIGGLVTTAGTGGSAGAPSPGPEAQWDCSASFTGCKDGSSGPWLIGAEACPVDTTRPLSEDDCSEGELFTCYLASTAGGDPILVNCTCEVDPGFCAMCLPPWAALEYEAACDGGARVCGCAVTGILIAR